MELPADEEQDGQEESKAMKMGEIDWSEFKRQKKRKARRWVCSGPFPRLVIAKEIAAVLLKLMYEFLQISGAEWERKQRAKAAAGAQRSYQVLEALGGKQVQQCMTDLGNVLATSPLALMVSEFPSRMRALRFCMVSAAMCSLHVVLSAAVFLDSTGKLKTKAFWPKKTNWRTLDFDLANPYF